MVQNHNRPGRVTNTPQHSVGAYGEGKSEKRAADGLPTNDDPHPAEEEKPYSARRPGGADTKRDTSRVNNAVHDGSAPPRPRNAENK